jgi:hypothetical protein
MCLLLKQAIVMCVTIKPAEEGNKVGKEAIMRNAAIPYVGSNIP